MDPWRGLVLVWLLAAGAGAPPSSLRKLPVPATALEIIPRESGPVNYYLLVDSPEGPYIHSAYRYPYETAVMGWKVPENLRRSVARLSFRWRADVLPVGGDECAKGHEDSAAIVYLTWKRGLRWYTLKYVWSAVGKKGAVCDKKRNPFVAQDTIIVESGGPLHQWKAVEIDLDAEFRAHFAGGDPEASVPDFGGFGIMSDGDQTHSSSEADFGDFALWLRP